ncbi:MAG: hypothetical protein ACP5GJ_02870 [Nanopusillaceae archaeon]|jgi:hypothetical protein
MVWKRMLLLLFLLFLAFKVYTEQPIVGYPQTINNQINLTNPSSYAEYLIKIYNPTNYYYYYIFSPLSSQWYFIFGENNSQLSGYIYPGEILNITIYLRPLALVNQIPQVVLYLQNQNITSQYYSFVIQFTPVIYYNQVIPKENITEVLPLISSFQLSNIEVTQNSYLYLLGIINNPNNFSENVSISLITDFGFEKNYTEIAQPGVNIYQMLIYIPNNVTLGEHYIYVYENNESYELNFTVIKLETTPNINVTYGNYWYKIIISNPYNYPINYTYYLKEYFGIFSIFNPKPNYIIKVNESTYAIYNIFLLPKNSFIIYESLNYYFVIGIIILAILVAFVIFYVLFKDNITITKEVSRVDLKNEVVDIVITIKNKSIFQLTNVTITEYVNEPLKIKEYKIAEPSSVYKSHNNYIINWKFDNIRRNEEIVLSYTAEIKDIKEYKNIEIPKVNIKYKYLFWNRNKYSNGLIIRVTK